MLYQDYCRKTLKLEDSGKGDLDFWPRKESRRKRGRRRL